MESELETQKTEEENDETRAAPAERPASRLPLALTLISLFIWFGFQTVALTLERNQLSAVNSNFESASREAEKMRAQLEALITKTAELASKGNPNAKIVIEELQKRGIPFASGPPPPK
jgi:hypothetical protein